MILKHFFNALSYLLHPLIIPLLGLYFLLSIETLPVSYNRLDALFYFPIELKVFLYIIMGILTVLAPLLSILIMYSSKMISSLKMEKREERIYPLIIGCLYYVLAYIYIRRQMPYDYMHPALIGFLFGTVLVFVVSLVVNFFVKISLHAVAIFGLCGAVIAYSQTQLPGQLGTTPTNLYLIMYLLILAGIIAAGRLYLKAHTLNEILLGSFVGFLVLYVSVKFGVFI
jgi:hypothetical protein